MGTSQQAESTSLTRYSRCLLVALMKRYFVIVSTPRAVLLNVPNRRGDLVPIHKSNVGNEKARRVFVLVHYFPPPLKNDRACYNNNFYIISFRIVDIMEVP